MHTISTTSTEASRARETAHGTHGCLDGVSDLPRADGSALDARHQQLADREADRADGDSGTEQRNQLRRHHLLERGHVTGSARNASPTTSRRAVLPSRSLPATIRRATGVSTSRWITRFSGRAPNTGS